MRGEFIGKGTFGRVYLAMNSTPGDLIAMRQVIFHPERERNRTQQTRIAEKLRLQCEMMKDLDHPNVVQYLGFEETEMCLSLFFGYIPGGSVSSIREKYGRFDGDTSKHFASQILSGLQYLHSKDILHRVRLCHSEDL